MAIIRRGESERGLTGRRGWDPFEAMQDLMRWDPLSALSRGTRDVGQGGEFLPAFEVKETKDSYIFKADLPGVEEKDLDIALTGSRLTISGRREEEKKDEGDTYYTYERSYGGFSRSFTLPDGVDIDHVQAELKDGVLSVVTPKRAEVQSKRIELKGKGEGKVKA